MNGWMGDLLLLSATSAQFVFVQHFCESFFRLFIEMATNSLCTLFNFKQIAWNLEKLCGYRHPYIPIEFLKTILHSILLAIDGFCCWYFIPFDLESVQGTVYSVQTQQVSCCFCCCRCCIGMYCCQMLVFIRFFFV